MKRKISDILEKLNEIGAYILLAFLGISLPTIIILFIIILFKEVLK